MDKRKYTKTLRAKQQENTRERIVEAVVALHEKLGPANTSIKAVAEKAGVQRLTVYRYFPDDFSLFEACTSHWLKLNPPPHMTDWEKFSVAEERTSAAMLAFYNYYRETEAMWTGAYRDVESIEALQVPMRRFEEYVDLVRDDLLANWKVTGTRRQQLFITLRHCLRFTTWRSLKGENLKDTQIVELVVSWMKINRS